tara:strand:- start:4946 stop:5200 length:255 start_codon:yes stop_codon:yes gene_type:complete
MVNGAGFDTYSIYGIGLPSKYDISFGETMDSLIAGGIINKIIFLPSSCPYSNHPPSIPTSSTGWRNNRLQVDLDGSGGLRGGAG